MYGEWRTSPEEYIEAVTKYRDVIGRLDWVAPQDWMCEPFIMKKTRLTIRAHQNYTVKSVLHLRRELGNIVIPVLQGWWKQDYLRCIQLYAANGIDLTQEPTVGIGSVCRRQSTDEILDIIQTVYEEGINIHGFGIKMAGIEKYGRYLSSADSMAWSFNARRMKRPLDECIGLGHKTCNNCKTYARQWYNRILSLSSSSGRAVAS